LIIKINTTLKKKYERKEKNKRNFIHILCSIQVKPKGKALTLSIPKRATGIQRYNLRRSKGMEIGKFTYEIAYQIYME
jgi:hypothetical protein